MTPANLRNALARALLVLAPGLVGCRAPAPGPGESVCPVCRCEGDLACLVVRVEADTPSATLAGVTYHFCSEECRARFAADPHAYLAR